MRFLQGIHQTSSLWGINLQMCSSENCVTRPRDEALINLTEPSLQFVFGLFRHGARSPAFPSYPTDPYKNYTLFFPEGEGALTKLGKQLMYKVGQTYKKLYGDFVGPIYSQNKIRFVSTNMERTIMSAMLVSTGMFPPQTYQQWSSDISWQPIPVWLDNSEVDKTMLYVNSSSCPRFQTDLSNLIAKLKQQDSMTDSKNLYDYISDHAGVELNSKYNLFTFWDIFECEDLSGYRLPNWTENVFPDQIKPIVEDIFTLMVTDTHALFRILSGPIFYFLRDLLLKKASNSLTPDWKMYVHAGHDVTVLAFLHGIGCKQPVIVRPGDSVFVELHHTSSLYYIKVLYLSLLNNEEELTELTIAGCGVPCELNTFISIVTALSPLEWAAECLL